ncbi:MAG: hypothetical protein O7B26_13295 [Planctomycetota bacterium]|nr:hypothetical protein [Planctomycetota bacterium]
MYPTIEEEIVMAHRVARLLREFERRKTDYGEGAGSMKLDLLRQLDGRSFGRASDLLRLHEILCFVRAYPDNKELLAQAERALERFSERNDLRRFRKALRNTGVAGTSIHFSFFASTAYWLARRWPSRLTIDWDEFEQTERLERLLSLLALPAESPGLDEYGFEVREWIDRMKGPNETDAAFLLRRLHQIRMSDAHIQMLYEDMDVPICLAPGPTTPARTREKLPVPAIKYQTVPFRRSLPGARKSTDRTPPAIRALSAREGRVVVDLAKSTMVTRERDLDAFAYGDPRDVRIVDCGDGLQFAYIGVIPQRRLILECLYGFIMLKNGVAVGYGTNTGLFGSSEVAFTVFDTFRAGEAALMYHGMLSIARHLFAADTFTVDPYQLGEDNEDAIQSGAWWFYHKLGFRPRDSRLIDIMRRELKRKQANPGHRSSPTTLRKLATASVFLHSGNRRDDVLGVLPLADVGLKITQYLATRFGHDRRLATSTCSREAARLLGVGSLRRFSTGERMAWQHWSPLIMILPGIRRWSRKDKTALVRTVRAKGGLRESEYLVGFDGHTRLRQAIQTLARSD